jgi:hypothetical protein
MAEATRREKVMLFMVTARRLEIESKSMAIQIFKLFVPKETLAVDIAHSWIVQPQ